jgi:hypothetical protein
MAKKSKAETELQEQLASLRSQLEAKDKALSVARKGLVKVTNLDPVSHTVPGEAKPSGLGFVRVFRKAQEACEKALLDSADAEVVVDG